MEQHQQQQYRKVKVIYMNDPETGKSRPVYVTATSQPNTYQIVQGNVIVSSTAPLQHHQQQQQSQQPSVSYVSSPSIMTTAAATSSTTTTTNSYQPSINSSPMPPQSYPQTFIQRPPQTQLHRIPPSAARRALIPQRPKGNAVRATKTTTTQIRSHCFPKLSAPLDYPEIKQFVFSKVLPKLTPNFIEEFFGVESVAKEDASVQPLVPQIQESKISSQNVQHIPSKIIPQSNKKRNAPIVMRRAVQSNRQRLTSVAPYSKENRQLRIINPVIPITHQGPKIRPAIIKHVRPVRPKVTIISASSSTPASNASVPPQNTPLQVLNPTFS